MTATPDTAPVEKIPLLVWGQKCLSYKGLLQCSSAPVPIIKRVVHWSRRRGRYRYGG